MWLPNFGYHFARWQGEATRRAYQAALPLIVRRKLIPSRELSLSVFAYSGEASLPEQVRSIRSFLRSVGRPREFVVVSDGTHSARSLGLLEAVDPVVSVLPAAMQLPDELPTKFRRYLTTHPLGKQLALILSLPRNGPALYTDSDVLFFPGGIDLTDALQDESAPAFYLPDCQECSADARLFRNPEEARQPVNTGLLLLRRPLDWAGSIERFEELDGPPTFFTNQTLVHLAMHANRARPFDPRRFVLQLDDQFVYPDYYASSRLVLRHYVNPVRHKFWTSGWL